jgi:hypothetical protein
MEALEYGVDASRFVEVNFNDWMFTNSIQFDSFMLIVAK